jgi:hypothetical protein
MIMKYPLKLIEWRDAYNSNFSWMDADEVPHEDQPHLIMTLGFEIRRTENHIVLAQAVGDGDRVCTLFTIPLSMIVREQTFRRR